MARTKIYKNCLFCGKPFVCDTKTARKMYCSISCGLKARSKFHNIDVDKVRELVAKNTDIYKICDLVGATYWVLRRIMTANGIRYPKKPLKQRSDGYWNYTAEQNHRKIIERFIGRNLLKTERVHHIDGDKTNNDISNLCLLSTESEHAKLHKQLEQVAMQLLKKGIIYFDYKEKMYKITNE